MLALKYFPEGPLFLRDQMKTMLLVVFHVDSLTRGWIIAERSGEGVCTYGVGQLLDNAHDTLPGDTVRDDMFTESVPNKKGLGLYSVVMVRDMGYPPDPSPDGNTLIYAELIVAPSGRPTLLYMRAV